MPREAATPTSPGRGWWLAIAWVGGLFLCVYLGAFRVLLHDWLTFDVSFGLVIVAISGYMIFWARRHLLPRGATPRPALAAGFLMTAFGNLLFLAGQGSGTLLLQELAILVTLFGLAWLLFGSLFIRVFWVPLCYLVFALPLPGELLGRLSVQLQTAAALVASTVLSLTGMPVIRNGTILELPHITLEVARLCNGSNHIVALMSLVIPLAFVSRLSAARKTFLVLCALVLGICLNGVRIAMIGWWSVSHRDLHGPLSTLFTSFIFFVGLAILSLFTLGIKSRQVAPVSGIPDIPAGQGEAGHDRRTRLAAIGIATALLGAVGLLIACYRPQPVNLKSAHASFPNTIGAWEGSDEKTELRFLGREVPDVEVRKVYRSASGQLVGLYIAYFAVQGQDHEVVTYRLDPLHENAQRAALVDGPAGPLVVNATSFVRNGRKQAAFFWYGINGRVITGRYLAKLSTAADWLLRRRTNGAVVILVPDTGGAGVQGVSEEQREFFRLAVPVISEFLRT